MTIVTDEPLHERRDGDVLIVTLTRPRARNAIDGRMLAGLEAVVAEAATDSSLRILLFEGAGGYFCAGGDLKERVLIAAGDENGVAQRNRREGEFLGALARLPQLVVGLVEGGAVGGGLGMLCACDLVFAREGSAFGTPEVCDGAVPAQVSPHLVRRVGAGHARRLLLTGARIDAVQAVAMGLIDDTFSQIADLDQVRAELLARLARCDRNAIAATKQLLAELVPFDPDYPARASELYRAQYGRKQNRELGDGL